MIEHLFRRSTPSFGLKVRWFSPVAPTLVEQCVLFHQCAHVQPVKGFSRTPFYTKIIPLGGAHGGLIESFRGKTAYEIRRAERDGIQFNAQPPVGIVEQFYNQFAEIKGLAGVHNLSLYYGDALRVTVAELGQQILAAHIYIADGSGSRIRLLHAASLHQSTFDTAVRAQIGRANRFLYFHGMLHYARNGFSEYDVGGYALGSADSALQRINDFKDSFGGHLREESNYTPWWLHFLRRIRRK